MSKEPIEQLIDSLYHKIQTDIGIISHHRSFDLARCTAFMYKHNTCSTSRIARFMKNNESLKLTERYITGILNSTLINHDDIMMRLIHVLFRMTNVVFYVSLHNFDLRNSMICSMLFIQHKYGCNPLFWKVKTNDYPIVPNDQIKLVRKLYSLIPFNKRCVLLANKSYIHPDIIIDAFRRRFTFILELSENIEIYYNGWQGYANMLIHDSEKMFYNVNLIKNKSRIPEISFNIFIIENQGKTYIFATNKELHEQEFKKHLHHFFTAQSSLEQFESEGYKIRDTQLKRPERIERLILLANIALIYKYQNQINNNLEV